MDKNSKRKHGMDRRLDQLIALAREGNEEAVSDLWKEYGVDFKKEGSGHDSN